MNRSTVRATAIRRVVAAGLISAGFLVPGTALAAADPGGAQGGHSGPSRDVSQQSAIGGGGLQSGRRQDRPAVVFSPGIPRGRLGPVLVADGPGGGVPAAPSRRLAPTALLPEAQIMPGGLIELDPESLPELTFTAPPAGIFDEGAVSPVPRAAVSPSAPALVPVTRTGEPLAHAALPATGRHPQPIGVAHLPSHMSVTAELTDASLGGLALLALPGLAVLVGMTGLGIRLGHRNAKASYVLQSMGTTRFLN